MCWPRNQGRETNIHYDKPCTSDSCDNWSGEIGVTKRDVKMAVRRVFFALTLLLKLFALFQIITANTDTNERNRTKDYFTSR